MVECVLHKSINNIVKKIYLLNQVFMYNTKKER